MGYDELLAERIRRAIGLRKGRSERAMFGGLCFMIDGKMFVGIMKEGDLMVRVSVDDHEKAIAKPHARTMDFTGREMKGFVLVKPAGIKTDAALRGWIDWAAKYVATLPAKKPRKKPKPKKTTAPKK